MGGLDGWVGWMGGWVVWLDGWVVLILKIGLDQATHTCMSRGSKNEARGIQSAPYWSDYFRGIVVIGCLKIQYTVLCFWLQ